MLNMMMRAAASRARILRASSNPETPGRLMSRTQISGRSVDESRLAAFGVGGFQNGDIRVAGQQRTAARGNDGMIVNDQDTHRCRSEGLTADTRKSVCSAIGSARAIPRQRIRCICFALRHASRYGFPEEVRYRSIR